MKKHCLEEKTDLQTGSFLKNELSGSSLIKFFFVFLVLSPDIFSQVPIQGFCKYNLYNTESGFTNLVAMNFNGDFYTDLVAFNPESKQITAIEGKPQGEFGEKQTSKIPLEINNISLLDYTMFPYMFAFTSRINMSAGVYEFRSSGRAVLMSSIKFDSYPENISIADINASEKKEMLVSGGAFNGLSLVFQEGSRLREKKIVQGTAFSQSSFIDLSNDGFPDIAAYDIVSGAFSFFYNNSLGEFRKVRSIPVTERITYLKTHDLNLDSYQDLIFASGKSINMWYGDFRSSYNSRKKLNTQLKPDKFILYDFNKDGLIDVAYLNLENSVVSIFYAKNEFEFYSEIIYLQKDGLKDIVPYNNRTTYGLAAISSDGTIHTITTLSSLADAVDLTIGGNPKAISFFNNDRSGTNDICFIDEYDSRIKFIVRNNAGIPNVFYSYPLYESHSKIIVESEKTGVKNFICFSPDKKLIEIITSNFNTGHIERTAIYSPGPIKDLKLKRNSEEDFDIYIAYVNNGGLNLGVFSNKKSAFTFSEQLIRKGDFIDASIGIRGGISVYYWYFKDNEISLLYKSQEKITEIPETLISIPVTESIVITSFTENLLNLGNDVSISFVSGGIYDLAVVGSDSDHKINFIIKGNETEGTFRITSKNQLFFGETRLNGLKELFVYIPERNVVNKLKFINRGRNIIQTKLADTSNIGGFFIKNMTQGNYHIVYTDTDRNCITIKRIRG